MSRIQKQYTTERSRADRDLEATAIDYIKRGFAVMPVFGVDESGRCLCTKEACSSAGKHPIPGRDYKRDIARDEVNARRIFRTHQNTNIGIATGEEYEIFTVDEDTYKGGSVAALGITLPETLTSITGGGGRQLVFKYPNNAVITDSAGKLADAVDVRGDGGMFVVAPSIHKSGKTYSWLDSNAEIAEAPEELVKLIIERSAASRNATITRYGVDALIKLGINTQEAAMVARKHESIRIDAEITDGKRNDTLFRIACRMQGDGFPDEAILEAVWLTNLANCDEPKERSEVETLVNSAITRYEKGERIWRNIQRISTPLPAAELFISWDTMKNTPYASPEYIIYGLSRGDVGLCQAVTNYGKSTMLRNLSVSLAAGKSFLNLAEEGEPRRVMLLDFETGYAIYADDLKKMTAALDDNSQTLVGKNFRSYIAKQRGVPYLNLTEQEHFERLVKDAKNFNADLIIIDTMTTAFTIKNENDNSEAMNEVMKPLTRLAVEANAAVLFAHHIGKSGSEEGSASNGHYRGRGASSFEGNSVSTIQINVKKNLSGERVVVLSYPKLKKAEKPDLVIKLDNEKRWFEATNETAINAADEKYRRVLALIKKPMRMTEIVEASKPIVASRTCKRYLSKAVKGNQLINEKGLYRQAGYVPV